MRWWWGRGRGKGKQAKGFGFGTGKEVTIGREASNELIIRAG